MATIDELLAEARAALGWRPTPDDLPAGVLLVDIRSAEQRERDGELPGALVIDRNVLEWRTHLFGDRPVVVVCNEGYQSSLAAATLRRLGVDATDLDGGFQAWLACRNRG